MTRPQSLLKYPILALFTVVMLAVFGIGRMFYASLPKLDGKVELYGLTDHVDVYRDTYSVPHIFAKNRIDALRTLGYLHASDRFFQMEMQRRAGQGRLAEVVGPDMVGVDKYIRTLGLYNLAQSSYEAMSPDAQALFQAYADGVNSWLKGHYYSLPPEFTLLGIHPKKWQPADSVVWGKLMALQLSSNYRKELLRAKLVDHLPPAAMGVLFPAWGNAPVTTEPGTLQKSESTSPSIEDKLSSITSLDHAASNEWVIAGSKTQSGKPILANDPHLSLNAPILWYLVRIVSPEFSVKGATVPGLPVVLLGQNNDIAWGLTTTGSDVEDLFIETVDPKDPTHYITPQGSQPFLTRMEEIKVKGEHDVIVTIRRTRHGPVMSDLDPEMAKVAGDGKVMALAFTGLGAKDRTAESLLRLNMAHHWNDFTDALKLYEAPPQNMVFANIKGDIGFINPGLVPIRKKGDGMLPVDGASGNYDWTATVPFEAWPRVLNPSSGYIFNANNAVLSAGSKFNYGSDWEEPYRALRMQHFFDSTDTHTLDSSAAMQADHVSLVARQLLPYILRLSFDSESDRKYTMAIAAQDMLRDWDGTMDKNRAQPLIFEAWLAEMHQRLLVDVAGQDLKERGPFAANSIAAILASNDRNWCKKDSCETMTKRALINALKRLSDTYGSDMHHWRWGQAHIALLQNKVFKRVPFLDRTSDLSVPSSGDFYTLDRGGSFDPPEDQPFARQHGGGYRGIYDLANPDRSRFMITTGQSESIVSPHYGDMVQMWNDVKSITLAGSKDDFTAQHAHKLEFLPTP